jgi:DUF1707 SHOCT-like domain
MDDRIRISDSDRDRVTARLRDFYAEGRLTAEELDERVTAALNAKTAGDLRAVMKDLPQSGEVPPRARQVPRADQFPQGVPSWGRPPRVASRRAVRRYRPRLLPLVLLAVLAALVVPGVAAVFFLAFKILLMFWLIVILAGLFVAVRFGWRLRRAWHAGYWPPTWHGGYRRL